MSKERSFTKDDVVNAMVTELRKKSIFVTYKDRKMLPQISDHIPRSMIKSDNPIYLRCYKRLWKESRKIDKPIEVKETKVSPSVIQRERIVKSSSKVVINMKDRVITIEDGKDIDISYR